MKNLLFFMVFIGGLLVLGAFVLKGFRDKDKVPPKEIDPSGILDEVTSSTANSCYFYLGSKLSETAHKYHTRQEIPPADELAKKLFNIPGVIEVTIDKTMVVLQKAPKAHWEEIRPAAREIITAHIHPKKMGFRSQNQSSRYLSSAEVEQDCRPEWRLNGGDWHRLGRTRSKGLSPERGVRSPQPGA
ncbi:MAG: NifU N-terminal domain-containing protein [Acidobacteriia bacterium]|nr:NifU N-terminal domain-containing protein [Terriglobia bacterium]